VDGLPNGSIDDSFVAGFLEPVPGFAELAQTIHNTFACDHGREYKDRDILGNQSSQIRKTIRWII